MNNKQNSNKFLMLRGLFLSAMLVVSILAHAKTETMVSNPDSLKTKESRDSTIYADFEDAFLYFEVLTLTVKAFLPLIPFAD